MGTFKLQGPARLILTQILAWNARAPRISVIRADRRFETRARDSQIVSDFRAKIRQTEDLMGKLSFHLREVFNDRT
jgi:hypothetical protein